MNIKISSDSSLLKRLSTLENEIEDLEKALELIPANSALATLSVRAALRLTKKKAKEITDELTRRGNLCLESV